MEQIAVETCYHDKALKFKGIDNRIIYATTLWRCTECGVVLRLKDVEEMILAKHNLNPYPSTAETIDDEYVPEFASFDKGEE